MMSLSPPPLINQRSDQRAPPSLMRSSDAGAVITVKVFVEQNIVAPVWVFLKLLGSAIDRTASFFISGEDANQPVGYLPRNLSQCHLAARLIWQQHAEMGAVGFA